MITFGSSDISTLNKMVDHYIHIGKFHKDSNDSACLWIYPNFPLCRIRCIDEVHYDGTHTRRYYFKEDLNSGWVHFASCFQEFEGSDFTVRIRCDLDNCS